MAKKKLQKALEHDTCVLPSEILFSILIRLSVQSLLRFRSVYKSWKIMISDKEFIKAHRDQTKALGREKLLTKQVGVSNYVFRDLESHQVLVSMDAKQLFPNEKFQGGSLVCSCDGLVLLKNPTTYKNYALWNPSTREYRLLKCSDDVKFREEPANACGLCYDSSISDYKVILIFKLFYVVYSMSTGSWTRRISSPNYLVQPYSVRWCVGGINIQDCLYWCLNEIITNYVRRNSTIIYFDVSSDEVKELETPNLDFIGDQDELFRLASVKGRLSVFGGKKHKQRIGHMDYGTRWLEVVNENLQLAQCLQHVCPF
ncbi:hypothetical protein T459_33349 [Capsicum annuum]|uniref:F-box domain-containing protein n=1 Tax=Capsicum annuum TaxID=4072 RepID=A0A2G2XZ45_CAPAN|nr:hypothetical protein T459_33349 [Capsicum annuum]